MADKLDFVCLIDGTVDLYHVALLNDALDVYEGNRRMADEAAERTR